MRPLTLMLAAALSLGAQAPAPPSPRHPAPMGGWMASALDLTPDQQAQMKAIREKHRAAMKAGRDAMRAQGQAFHAAMADPKASEAQLRQAYDQMNAQRFQSLLDQRAMRQEMRAVLTPDQQAKADAMRAQFQARMKARMERRHGDWMDHQAPPAPQNP